MRAKFKILKRPILAQLVLGFHIKKHKNKELTRQVYQAKMIERLELVE